MSTEDLIKDVVGLVRGTSSSPLIIHQYSEAEQKANAELIMENVKLAREKRFWIIWQRRGEGFIAGVFFTVLAAALYALYWSK